MTESNRSNTRTAVDIQRMVVALADRKGDKQTFIQRHYNKTTARQIDLTLPWHSVKRKVERYSILEYDDQEHRTKTAILQAARLFEIVFEYVKIKILNMLKCA